MEWSTACLDWERRIIAGESLIPTPPLFPDQAESALEVFRELRLKDLGGVTMGQACRPWIINFVSAVFGAYDAESGKRLITDFFLLIAKKNSKSTTAAGIMLTALVRNWRESAEYLIISPTIEIANNSFYPARDMVRLNEDLSDILHVQDHYRTITHRVTGASLKVVAADNEAVSGKKASGVLVDELWLFGKQANAENMLLEATGGQAARPEGFTIFLSTQSDEPPSGVFLQKLQYARGVRDGRINDPCFMPVLYEFPKWMIREQKHRDPAYFYVTNPNLSASVREDYIPRKLAEAAESGEGSIRKVEAKHLNVEMGMSLGSDRWAGADFWEGQARDGLTLEEVLRRSGVATIGIDGGGLDDLLGLAVIGRDRETREWLHWGRAWAHKSVLERRKAISGQLQDFAEAGDLVLVERVGQDVEEVAEIVARVNGSGLMESEDDAPRIGVDPYGIGAILDAIAAAKVNTKRVTGISQGWKLNAAITTAERKLADGTLVHAGSPLMAWCVSNAKVEPKGNAVLITKQASGRGKIDPLMALFDAVALMALNPQTRRPREHRLMII